MMLIVLRVLIVYHFTPVSPSQTAVT